MSPPGPNTSIKVLVVDDSSALLSAWQKLLGQTPSMTPVGGVDRLADVEIVVESSCPDVVLLDLTMNAQRAQRGPEEGFTLTDRSANHSSLQVLANLCKRRQRPRVLIYSGHTDRQSIELAKQHGAAGFVGKHEEPAAVLEAIRRVHAGEFVFPRWA